MPIIANANSRERETIPAGNYIARCYQIIQLGTVEQDYNGEIKKTHLIRITWELPTELRVFDESKGEQPFTIGQKYTLSMHEKALLRKTIAEWRGQQFSPQELQNFDITSMLGKPCMLNIIHKPSKDGQKVYANVGAITPMPRGIDCPPPINTPKVLSFDNFDWEFFNSLPDFIKEMIQSSDEFLAMKIQREMDGAAEQVPDVLF